MKHTLHSHRRKQQRCIPPGCSEWLEIYGEIKRAPGDAYIRYFSKQSKRMIKDEFGVVFYKKIKSLLNVYEIVRNDTVITSGWLNQKIR